MSTHFAVTASDPAVAGFIQFLLHLDYRFESGTENTLVKSYGTTVPYLVRVSVGAAMAACTVNYGPKIRYDRATTLNFAQPESVVVLECVDSLLIQGYAPETIYLEKAYQVGHGDKYLDVLVYRGKKAFMMIECKTSGSEFDKAISDFRSKGGQLMSYWLQDRDAKFIVLYASCLKGGEVERTYFAVESNGLSGSNLAEVHASWDRESFDVGLLEGAPYLPQERQLRVRSLKDMRIDDGGKVFNGFAEILRRHAISDLPNAFNKIFNLFICKVQDEEKSEPDEILDFQWLTNAEPETVLGKLSDLYKRGMRDYLQMSVADHSTDEVEESLVSLSTADRVTLRRIFNELRLYKNNEFAFLEVYDRKTFLQNAEVVKDVVRLLQGKRLRYTHKQQFMGDFFERLLNTSVKQESGQFFTPIPIARFVLNCLPVEEMIRQKLAAQEPNFMPYFLDYAAGSGHFMTESMDRFDGVLKKLTASDLRSRTQKSNHRVWAENYKWASEFVYGVEKDYRLAKTGKVSCFLNGDGEANLICGDGLDHFAKSETYSGRLKSAAEGSKDNQSFDVVAANPPYSVRQCRQMVRNGDESFELWPRLTDKSDDIECLFLERTKQVLVDGGVAGVIVPVSILSNDGIEAATRDMLLKYFELIAVVILGSQTFMKANVTTATLFLKRRPSRVVEAVAEQVQRFFSNWVDASINGIPTPAATYARTVWNLSIEEYVASLRGLTPEQHPIFARLLAKETALATKSAKRSLTPEELAQVAERTRQQLVEIERDKLLHFVLAAGRTCVVVNGPSDTAEQVTFLGYEFSERRGHEGLWPVGGDKLQTVLFDEENCDNPDKISWLIRRNFLGQTLSVPAHLQSCTSVVPLMSMLSFKGESFDKAISTRFELATGGAHRLEEFLDLKYGERITKAAASGTKYPVFGGGDATFRTDMSNACDAVVVSRFGMSEQCVRNVVGEFWLLDSALTVSPKVSSGLSQAFLFAVLKALEPRIFQCGEGQAQKNLNIDKFKALKVPNLAVITPSEQEAVVRRMSRLAFVEQECMRRVTLGKQSLVDSWTQATVAAPRLTLSCLTSAVVGPKPKIRTKDARPTGRYPVIAQDAAFNCGFTDAVSEPVCDLPVVVFGDHTKVVKFVDVPFVRGADGVVLLKGKPGVASTRYLYWVLRFVELNGSSKYTRHMSLLKEAELPAVPHAFQNVLVNHLDELQSSIDQLERRRAGIPARRLKFMEQWLSERAT